MAITKCINPVPKTHGGMRNCIEYVLGEAKIQDNLIDMTGPSPETLNWDSVYQSFLEVKDLWHKDRGRMCLHSVISFHKDEKITAEQVFEFAKTFVEQWFRDFQTLFAVHLDRDHLHIHMVTNTVSFVDGHKLHSSKRDLEKMKELTNEMCRERELTIAVKGHHFDGTEIEPGTVRGWSKNKYRLLQNESKRSFVADCGLAVMKAMENCYSREEFIDRMMESGWRTTWTENRKHITFENVNGEKVRDRNLNRTFNMNIGKEDLIHEFTRQSEERRRLEAERREREAEERQLAEYYAEVESAIAGADAVIETAEGNGTVTDRIIRQAELGIDDAEAIEKDSVASRSDREAERRRLDLERERDAQRREREPDMSNGRNRALGLESGLSL